jgi:hypothetical protein
MKVVRGIEEARWLPSRHRFALFRLAGYVRLRNAAVPAAGRDDLVLAVDRDQSVFENYGIATWTVLTIACYFAGGLLARWPLPLALLASIPLATIAMNIPFCTFGALRPNRNNIRLNSAINMLLLLAAALYYARAETWVRFVAWQFLAVVALNAVAAAIVFLLRGPIARLEAAFAA